MFSLGTNGKIKFRINFEIFSEAEKKEKK